MIDIEKSKKLMMRKFGKKELVDMIIVMTKTENALKELFPEAFACYVKAATIVAKKEACELLKTLRASQEEVDEFRHMIEENEC